MQSSQPIDIATCMYRTGLDPFTGQEVFVAKHLRDRKLQRALIQSFKPENDFEVRQALMAAGRSDLVGAGGDCLIPAQPPRSALQARMTKARRELGEGRYVHTIEQPVETVRAGRTKPGKSPGYRPHRKSSRNPRQPR